MKLTLSGTPASALTGAARITGLDASAGLDGGLTITPEGRIAGTGRISLAAKNPAVLMAALGVAVPDWPDSLSRELSAEADAV